MEKIQNGAIGISRFKKKNWKAPWAVNKERALTGFFTVKFQRTRIEKEDF